MMLAGRDDQALDIGALDLSIGVEMINHFGVRLGAGLGAYPGVIP
ncbi:hypothetical protein [Nocardia cyriacigeorgica]|nr:hypothetical protein [Nocardia cyriacigeorgica]